MRRKTIIIIGAIILIIIVGIMVFGTEITEPPLIEKDIITFSSDTNADADIHPITEPKSRYMVFDLGKIRTLDRVSGTVRIGYDYGAGSGSALFFMSDTQPIPEFGDMAWIRVRVSFNYDKAFDNNVYPIPEGYETQTYKTDGRYFIIGCSPDMYMDFAEGTIYLQLE